MSTHNIELLNNYIKECYYASLIKDNRLYLHFDKKLKIYGSTNYKPILLKISQLAPDIINIINQFLVKVYIITLSFKDLYISELNDNIQTELTFDIEVFISHLSFCFELRINNNNDDNIHSRHMVILDCNYVRNNDNNVIFKRFGDIAITNHLNLFKYITNNDTDRKDYMNGLSKRTTPFYEIIPHNKYDYMCHKECIIKCGDMYNINCYRCKNNSGIMALHTMTVIKVTDITMFKKVAELIIMYSKLINKAYFQYKRQDVAL